MSRRGDLSLEPSSFIHKDQIFVPADVIAVDEDLRNRTDTRQSAGEFLEIIGFVDSKFDEANSLGCQERFGSLAVGAIRSGKHFDKSRFRTHPG